MYSVLPSSGHYKIILDEVKCLSKKIFQAVIVEHCTIGKEIKKIVLHTECARACKPGQFLHIKIGKQSDPLLRRPISISDVDVAHDTITLIYRIVGKGTELLADYMPGEELDCMGPLGHGFTIQGERPLLVGGGMGLAPLIYLARSLCPRPTQVLMGGRTETELFWTELFQEVCDQLHITTDDGSMGVQGTVIDLLHKLSKEEYDMIYTCGPRPMMEAVATWAKQQHIPCQVSLEEHMACGMGVCLVCTCATNDGKRRKVCTEGPAFWAEEVLDC